MKKLLALILTAATALAQVNVTRTSGPDSTGVLNKGFVVGNGNSITATGNGSIIATGGTATSVPWSGVTGTPTTLLGYGVTNTLTTTAPITGGGLLSGNLTLAIPAATGSVNGYLTSADWTTFNAKQSALTFPLSRVNGGTGLSVAGAVGNLLTSDGTNWVSSAPAPSTAIIGYAGQVLANGTSGTSQTGNVTLTLPAAVTGVNSITSATGQTLTLATLDGNANLLLSPGKTLVTGTQALQFGATSAITIASSNDATSGDLVFTPSTTGRFKFGAGLQLTGASGAATTISTTTTNASLFLTANGTGQIVSSGAGSTSTLPRYTFASDTNTGIAHEGTDTDRFFAVAGGSTIMGFYNTLVYTWKSFQSVSDNDSSITLGTTGNRWSNIYLGTTTRSGPGAVPITHRTVKLTTTGVADALTLANGADGQMLTIVHDVDGGSAVLTPTTKTGFSTVTFTNAGDTVSLVYVTTRGWMVTGSYLAVIAP